ncbi:hypothetical protein Ga0074812_10429 [Parafrankia irregularis]|uniref:Uncharacterized protein n=1 Tax=Parafrankia irregularis TaxID=795642 RepID=A0A0S4QJG9_9ACTN|nr:MULTISPECIES: hypothetical protein [Parafrankia]MBE3204170.1 hypothetical protein [Parafrankia sp. CH37]CUU54952.1 hypothetical protein Ga0074812_10429 [Parafrankia irregularis]
MSDLQPNDDSPARRTAPRPTDPDTGQPGGPANAGAASTEAVRGVLREPGRALTVAAADQVYLEAKLWI